MAAPWGQRPGTRLAGRRRGRLGLRAQRPPAFRPALADARTRSASALAAPAALAPCAARTAPSSPLSPRLTALEFEAPRDPLFSPVFLTYHCPRRCPTRSNSVGSRLGPPAAPPPGAWPQAPPPRWFAAHLPASELAQAPGCWVEVRTMTTATVYRKQVFLPQCPEVTRA